MVLCSITLHYAYWCVVPFELPDCIQLGWDPFFWRDNLIPVALSIHEPISRPKPQNYNAHNNHNNARPVGDVSRRTLVVDQLPYHPGRGL